MPSSHQTNKAWRRVTREDPMFIVLNVGSGNNEVAVRIATLRKILEEAGQTYEILPVDKAHQLFDVTRYAVGLAQQRHGVVVAAGGDGTLNAVARQVLPSGCPFGVLPHGTFNYFSRAHGISSDMTEAAQALLRATLKPVQVGVVNQQIFLVNASLGLYAQVFEDRESYKKRLGRSRVIALGATILTILRSHRLLTLHLESEEKIHIIHTPTLVIGNNEIQLERLGIPDVPALQQDRLIAIAIGSVGVMGLLRLVYRSAMGELGQTADVVSFAFRRLTVNGRFPFRYRRIKAALDGEVTWLNFPLVFEVAQTPLWLLAPDSSASQEEDS